MPDDTAASGPPGTDQSRFLERVRPREWRNPKPQRRYDWVVLGAGPAGLAGACAARAAGLTVALVERHWLGGNSLNSGSIPSKALVRTGLACHALFKSPQFGGPDGTEPTADLAAAMRRMRGIRTRIAEYC